MTGYIVCFLIIGIVMLMGICVQWMQSLPVFFQILICGLGVVLILAFLINHFRKRRAEQRAFEVEYNAKQKEMSYRPSAVALEELKQVDKNFQERALLEYSEEILGALFEARERLDTQFIKFKVSDTLYEIIKYQIEDLQDSNTYEKHHITQFLGLQIVDYRKDAKDEYIDVHIEAYVEKGRFSKGTQKIAAGERYFIHQMTYRLTFVRKLGKQTKDVINHETQCESCGGIVDVSKGDYCPFCHTYIAMGSSGWMLDDLEEHSRYA